MKYLLPVLLLLTACTGVPKGIEPVEPFDLTRYLGQWYEIARLDHSFERGMDQVTANYSMREDGGVRVINKGFVTDENEWDEAEGKAYFVDRTDIGRLKVSFFGPFYGSYIVIALDEGYGYSMVSGPDRDYLWILSRTPQMDPAVLESLLAKADALGFATGDLIYPEQPAE